MKTYDYLGSTVLCYAAAEVSINVDFLIALGLKSGSDQGIQILTSGMLFLSAGKGYS